MNIKDKDKLKEIFQIFKGDDIIEIGEKIIGIGGFGSVTEVKTKNGKYFAGKLIKNEKTDEIKFISEFKNKNIVQTIKIYNKSFKGENYSLILMEKAILKDLTTLNQNLFKGLLKIIIDTPFEGVVGDNLIRFYARQIIDGLESIDRNDICHFDIKTDNLLIFIRMKIKLSDFSLLKQLKNKEKGNKTNEVEIPGGTPGYLSPEYYQEKEGKRKVSFDVAKKQDYFAFGSTLFYLKYGEEMLPYNEYDDDLMTSDYIIDLLQRAVDLIQSKEILSDKDFKKFLCSLINYDPNERPNFEEIYRNKWVNKNVKEINKIYAINSQNEEKLIMELNKSDFLITKKNELKKSDNKFIFNYNKNK